MLQHVDLGAGDPREALPEDTTALLLTGRRPPSLAALRALPNLTALTLRAPWPELAFVQELPGLTSLALAECREVDLGPLADHPSLETLGLPPVVRGAGALARLPRLGSLSVVDPGPLAGLTLGLHSLWLGPRTLELSVATRLPALRLLHLSGETSPVASLAPLAGHPSLERLRAQGARLTDLRPLATVPRLAELELPHTPGLTDLRPLAALGWLARLDLNLCTALVELAPLRDLPELREVRLRGSRVELLAGLPEGVRALYLERSRLRSLAGVERLRDLGVLWIWGTKVRDLGPLAGLPALAELNVASLGAPRGTEALAELPALTALDVHQTSFEPELLAGRAGQLTRVRGCPWPPPSTRRLAWTGEGPGFGAGFGVLRLEGAGRSLAVRGTALAVCLGHPASGLLVVDGRTGAVRRWDGPAAAVRAGADGWLVHVDGQVRLLDADLIERGRTPDASPPIPHHAEAWAALPGGGEVEFGGRVTLHLPGARVAGPAVPLPGQPWCAAASTALAAAVYAEWREGEHHLVWLPLVGLSRGP